MMYYYWFYHSFASRTINLFNMKTRLFLQWKKGVTKMKQLLSPPQLKVFLNGDLGAATGKVTTKATTAEAGCVKDLQIKLADTMNLKDFCTREYLFCDVKNLRNHFT